MSLFLSLWTRWIHDYQDACVDKLERFLRQPAKPKQLPTECSVSDAGSNGQPYASCSGAHAITPSWEWLTSLSFILREGESRCDKRVRLHRLNISWFAEVAKRSILQKGNLTNSSFYRITSHCWTLLPPGGVCV